MKHRVYAILDTKAEAGLPPFFSQNDRTACRAVSDLVNDQSHQFGRHPMDYTLYVIGEYDDGTLQLTAFPAIEVCPLVALKNKE